MKRSFCNRVSLPKCFFLILLALSFLVPLEKSSAQQQGIPSEGKDFYLGYVYPSFNKNPPGGGGRNVAPFYGALFLISSYEDKNQVTIAYFDPQSGKEVPAIVKFVGGRNAIEVPIDQIAMRPNDTGDISEYRACHITSKKPVNVQFFSTGACSGGSYLALPTIALGKKYVIASYNDNPGDGAFSSATAEKAGGFFEIIASSDSTNVSIIPNGLTARGHVGVNSGAGSNGTKRPYNVLLQRGQIYLVKGDGSDVNNDMSGSIVTSDKPIAVLAGHEDALLGSSSGHTTDARNYMIQQLIPADDFESTGYVSIPMKESVSLSEDDPGHGENYRVFVFDTDRVDVLGSDTTTTHDMGTFAYNHPAKEIQNIQSSTEFHSPSGGKFSVMMYDLRAQGAAPPYPAPAMMTIVPMSHWRTSFLFDIPANSFVVLQSYYISLIGLRTDIDRSYIKYTLNGSITPVPLTGLSNKGTYQNIPHHTELKGVRYSVSPGAYYFTNTRDAIKNPLSDTGAFSASSDQVAADTGLLHGSFMIYHYGFRAIDPDRDLGDMDGDDYFYEYATPVGMMVSNGSGYPKPTAKADTLCSSWHVCASDPNGVRSVQLLDDPGGNFIRPGKRFYNAHFDPALDPDNIGEIVFSGKDTSVCFDIIVSNPLDSAYAPLYIVDAVGNHVDPIPEFHYQPAHVRLSKLPDLPVKIDTLVFPPMEIREEVCSTLVYINTSLGTSGKSMNVLSVSLKKNNSQIKISQVIPSLPATLKAGDTLKVQVCFKPDDTLLYKDSIVIKTDCFEAPLPIVGSGGTPLIFATDIDFGDVIIGTTSRKPLTVRNVGTIPFILGKDWFLHNQAIFSMEPASANLLPVTLQPGGKAVTLYFDYTPLAIGSFDSTSVNWNSDIPEPYTQQIKAWSYLKGRAIKPQVSWDKERQYFLLDSTFGFHSTVKRVQLLNNGSAKAHVDKVFIKGQTSSEFSIHQDQINILPFGNFDMDPFDSIWVDIEFNADISKPYPDRYADRVDSIVATYFNPADPSKFDSTFIKLIGVWNKSGVKAQPQLSSFSIRPNPVSGRSIILSFSLPGSDKVDLSIFDVLGREVYHEARGMMSAGNHDELVALPNLETGIYYLRLTVGGAVRTEKLEIVK